MPSDLALFTSSFPFGNSETFLENEITYLAKGFETVFVFPLDCKGRKRNLPKNVEVICFKQIPSRKKKIEILSKNLFSILSILNEEVFLNRGFKNPVLMQLDYIVKYYYLAEQLRDVVIDKQLQNSVFYSYWFEQWASVLSIAKEKGIINKFISRAHGFDVYRERHKTGQIPFRRMQIKQINRVFCVSKAGRDYLKKIYPGYSDKIVLSYLGTTDYGVSGINPTKEYRLLSISNIYPVKRVSLIVELLLNMDIKLSWTHFGDGELMGEIREKIKALPGNIQVELKGRVPNRSMLEKIKKGDFDLFINVSESEGLPVSIMEAIGFGIPVIATDVGGTSEIVNKQTGVLIDGAFNPTKEAETLARFLKNKARNIEFRQEVRGFWKENFDAEKNYSFFVKKLIGNK